MPHKKAKKSIRDANTKDAGYDNAPTSHDMVPLPNGHPTPSAIPFAPHSKTKVKKAKAAPKLNSFGGRNELAGMSKSAHRILNAGAVREQYNADRKRRRDEEEGKTNHQGKKPLEPLPYESLSTFNRRVEIALRPSIDTAIRHSKASSAKAKNAKKAAAGPAGADADADSIPKEGEAITSGNQKSSKVATAEESVDPHAKKQKVRTGPTEFEEASQRRSVGDVVQAPPTLKKARRGLAPTTKADQALPVHRQPVSEGIRKMMEVEREKAIRVYRELKVQREAEQREAKEKDN